MRWSLILECAVDTEKKVAVFVAWSADNQAAAVVLANVGFENVFTFFKHFQKQLNPLITNSTVRDLQSAAAGQGELAGLMRFEGQPVTSQQAIGCIAEKVF